MLNFLLMLCNKFSFKFRAQNLPFSLDPRKVYRGTTISIINEMQMMGLQFGVTGFCQRLFVGNSHVPLSNSQEQASAILGGGITATFVTPIELIMIQQQVHGGSIFGTSKRILLNYGSVSTKGMFRGLQPTMLRDSIYVYGSTYCITLIECLFAAHNQLTVLFFFNKISSML